MTIKDMPHVTVEQILALREAAIMLEIERDELVAHVDRLRDYVGLCRDVVELTQWGYDGDCGSINKINIVIDEALSETPAQSLEALKKQWREEFALEKFKAGALIMTALEKTKTLGGSK